MHTRKGIIVAAVLAAGLLRGGNAGAGGIATDDPTPVCGDVNDSGKVTSSDALQVLKKAVGQPVSLACENCPIVVDYGNDVEFGFSSANELGYLVGGVVKVSSPMLVTHLGLIAKVAGPHVQLGLYTDNDGSPDQLVAAGDVGALGVGFEWFPVTASTLPAGYYWIVGVFDDLAHIGIDYSDSLAVVRYRTFTLGNPLPTTFGASLSYTGQKFNYFVRGIQ